MLKLNPMTFMLMFHKVMPRRTRLHHHHPIMNQLLFSSKITERQVAYPASFGTIPGR